MPEQIIMRLETPRGGSMLNICSAMRHIPGEYSRIKTEEWRAQCVTRRAGEVEAEWRHRPFGHEVVECGWVSHHVGWGESRGIHMVRIAAWRRLARWQTKTRQQQEETDER